MLGAPIFIKSKEEALPDVKNWLERAFREKKGYFVPKREVFGAYVDFCAEHHFESTTPASFGKFLKKVFPGVETRRLIRNNEQAMYYYNLTPASAPASSRRWTTVQSSSASASSGSETKPASSTSSLSSSMPAAAIYTSSSLPSPTTSPSQTRRRRLSSLEDRQLLQQQSHIHGQQQQRLSRSVSPSQTMFGSFSATSAAPTPLSTIPRTPTFQPSPAPSPTPAAWSGDDRRSHTPASRAPTPSHADDPTSSRGDDWLSSSGEVHQFDELANASMRRIKEERRSYTLPSAHTLLHQHQQQQHEQQLYHHQQQHQQQQQHIYHLLSTMSAQHTSAAGGRASDTTAAFAAAALHMPGLAYTSTTYDSAWAGMDYLYPLMAAMPHSAMALAAAAAAASHHQQHGADSLSPARQGSPPMVITTATSTTTTATTALPQALLPPAPIFTTAWHPLPAPSSRKHDRSASSDELQRNAHSPAAKRRRDAKSGDQSDDDKPLQPAIKDEPHDYSDNYHHAGNSSYRAQQPLVPPTATVDTASAGDGGGGKKKSGLDFILN